MLNAQGEVADLLNVNQFEGGHSAYECVAFSAALAYYAGEPGHGPKGTVDQASNLAQQWYAVEEGDNSASNVNGMSLDAEYAMLAGLHMAYKPLPATLAAVKQSLAQGCLVLLCGAEAGFYDLNLGDIVPYAWSPSGNHCIVASGIASDGNLLVHDCASIAPDGVRPGPRHYDAARMQIVSATAIPLPWQGGTMPIPQGWRDANSILIASNGVPVVLGFREHILAEASWDGGNVPQAPESHADQVLLHNAGIGGGQRQLFRDGMLWYTPGKGVVQEPYLGMEIDACYKEIAALKAQLAQAQPPATNTDGAIADLKAIKTTIDAAFAKVLADLGAS